MNACAWGHVRAREERCRTSPSCPRRLLLVSSSRMFSSSISIDIYLSPHKIVSSPIFVKTENFPLFCIPLTLLLPHPFHNPNAWKSHLLSSQLLSPLTQICITISATVALETLFAGSFRRQHLDLRAVSGSRPGSSSWCWSYCSLRDFLLLYLFFSRLLGGCECCVYVCVSSARPSNVAIL